MALTDVYTEWYKKIFFLITDHFNYSLLLPIALSWWTKIVVLEMKLREPEMNRAESGHAMGTISPRVLFHKKGIVLPHDKEEKIGATPHS